MIQNSMKCNLMLQPVNHYHNGPIAPASVHFGKYLYYRNIDLENT